MRPQNPVSNVYYRGGNRFRLMNAAIVNGYKDPRWCTYIQAKENEWQVQKGAKGVLCEKWRLSKEIVKLELPSLTRNESFKIAEDFIQSSKCPIKEVAGNN